MIHEVKLIRRDEIHPGAKIGRGFFIDDGNGVVVGNPGQVIKQRSIAAG